MVPGPEESLRQSSSAMTGGSSRPERAARQEAAADVLCTICMSDISDAAHVDGCLHSFCLGCIQQWAARRAVCPLCRRPFDRLLHTVRAEDNYQEYLVISSARPPRLEARPQLPSSSRPGHNAPRPRPSAPGPVRRRRGLARRLRRQPSDAAPWRSGAPSRHDSGQRPAEPPVRGYDLGALRAQLVAFVEGR